MLSLCFTNLFVLALQRVPRGVNRRLTRHDQRSRARQSQRNVTFVTFAIVAVSTAFQQFFWHKNTRSSFIWAVGAIHTLLERIE